MKLLSNRVTLGAVAAAALVLTPVIDTARADVVIDSFDTDTTGWSATWGTAPVLEFDSDDSSGSASSGSLKVTAGYFTPAADGWEQMVITRTFPSPVVGSEFKSVSVDVKVDASSVKNSDGNYGYFELKRTDGTALGGVNLSSLDWTTITFPLAPTEGTLSGVIIQNGNATFQGPITYKLDNFRFNAPPPPATVVDTFDTEDTATPWTATWGSSPKIAWTAEDAGKSDTSGSLQVTADYFTPAGDGWEQLVVTRTLPTPVVGADHVAIQIDVKVDPTSVPDLDGNYGYFEFKRTDGTPFGGVNLTQTNWTTIKFPLPPTEGTISQVLIQIGNGGFQGPIIIHLDNFQFIQKSGGPQPPTLAIEKNTKPGLKLYASAPGQAYQRQNVLFAPSEQFENSLWWVNQGAPVSYSVTWADFPDKDAYRGFQGQIILTRDTGKGVTPDWDDANVIMIEFQYVGTPTGAKAQARFLHKVNEAANNAMLYRTPDNAAAGPVGVLGAVQAPSMLGTWTVAFKNDSDITLTAPDGASTDIVMPAEDISYFEPTRTGISALFGVQPNSDTRVGLSAVISEIKITKGDSVVIDEKFETQDLDPAYWTVRAQDKGGVFALPADTAFLVSWGLPDTGFTLQAASSWAGPWAPTADPVLVGARRVLKINSGDLPGKDSGYFQLIQTPAQ